MNGKYDKYLFDPPPVIDKMGDIVRIIGSGIIAPGAQSITSLTLNYHFVNRPYVSKSSPHTHDYHEFLAWYGGNPEDPDDFGAEIVLYLGEELIKYAITKPTLVWLPPGFSHCPMEITRVDRPVFQVAMSLGI